MKSKTPAPEPLRIKSSDIPREYGFSRTTLWRLRKEGILKPVGRIGQRELVYLRAEIEEYMTSML